MRDLTDSTVPVLRARCAQLRAHLLSALAHPGILDAEDWMESEDWIITGVGASEGPARLLVEILNRFCRCRAEFVPLSAFVDQRWGQDLVRGKVFVLLSQALSPNARLALRVTGDAKHSVVVTATPEHASLRSCKARGATLVVHKPADESGLLLRILGPSLATIRILELGALIARRKTGQVPPSLDLSRVAALLGELPEIPPIDLPPGPREGFAFLTCGPGQALAQGLRWKWLEGIGQDPSVWDALSFVHGPWQHVHDHRYVLCSLEAADDPSFDLLLPKLAQLLVPGRHRLLRLRARMPYPLAIFELDAQVNEMVLRCVEHSDRSLCDWPGRAREAPLYDLTDAAEDSNDRQGPVVLG